MLATSSPVITEREATAADIPALVALGQRFRRETVYATTLRENVEAIAKTVAHLIASADGYVHVLERDGALVGVFGALLYPHHLSGDLTCGEVFFWVNPESRGHGVRMLRHAERWAKARGATTMQMVAPTTEVGQLYERMGYGLLEMAYGKDLSR